MKQPCICTGCEATGEPMPGFDFYVCPACIREVLAIVKRELRAVIDDYDRLEQRHADN